MTRGFFFKKDIKRCKKWNTPFSAVGRHWAPLGASGFDPGFDPGFNPGFDSGIAGRCWTLLGPAGRHWAPLGTFVLILQLVAGNY